MNNVDVVEMPEQLNKQRYIEANDIFMNGYFGLVVLEDTTIYEEKQRVWVRATFPFVP